MSINRQASDRTTPDSFVGAVAELFPAQYQDIRSMAREDQDQDQDSEGKNSHMNIVLGVGLGIVALIIMCLM